MISDKMLIKAAAELNDLMGLKPPIKLKGDREELTAGIKAAMKHLTPQDELDPKVQEVIDELRKSVPPPKKSKVKPESEPEEEIEIEQEEEDPEEAPEEVVQKKAKKEKPAKVEKAQVAKKVKVEKPSRSIFICQTINKLTKPISIEDLARKVDEGFGKAGGNPNYSQTLHTTQYLLRIASEWDIVTMKENMVHLNQSK